MITCLCNSLGIRPNECCDSIEQHESPEMIKNENLK